MGNQFRLAAYPENTVPIDLAARRIIYWIESAIIEIYLFIVDGRHSESDTRESFLFYNFNLSFYALIIWFSEKLELGNDYNIEITYDKLIKSHLSAGRQGNHYRQTQMNEGL